MSDTSYKPSSDDSSSTSYDSANDSSNTSDASTTSDDESVDLGSRYIASTYKISDLSAEDVQAAYERSLASDDHGDDTEKTPGQLSVAGPARDKLDNAGACSKISEAADTEGAPSRYSSLREQHGTDKCDDDGKLSPVEDSIYSVVEDSIYSVVEDSIYSAVEKSIYSAVEKSIYSAVQESMHREGDETSAQSSKFRDQTCQDGLFATSEDADQDQTGTSQENVGDRHKPGSTLTQAEAQETSVDVTIEASSVAADNAADKRANIVDPSISSDPVIDKGNRISIPSIQTREGADHTECVCDPGEEQRRNEKSPIERSQTEEILARPYSVVDLSGVQEAMSNDVILPDSTSTPFLTTAAPGLPEGAEHVVDMADVTEKSSDGDSDPNQPVADEDAPLLLPNPVRRSEDTNGHVLCVGGGDSTDTDEESDIVQSEFERVPLLSDHIERPDENDQEAGEARDGRNRRGAVAGGRADPAFDGYAVVEPRRSRWRRELNEYLRQSRRREDVFLDVQWYVAVGCFGLFFLFMIFFYSYYLVIAIGFAILTVAAALISIIASCLRRSLLRERKEHVRTVTRRHRRRRERRNRGPVM